MSTSAYANIIYDNFIFDVSKIVDIAALFHAVKKYLSGGPGGGAASHPEAPPGFDSRIYRKVFSWIFFISLEFIDAAAQPRVMSIEPIEY